MHGIDADQVEWWVTYSPWCVHTIETEALADPSVQHLRQSLARLYLGRRPVIRLTRPDPGRLPEELPETRAQRCAWTSGYHLD